MVVQQKSWVSRVSGCHLYPQGVGLLHPRHSNAVRNIVPPWQPKKPSKTSIKVRVPTVGSGTMVSGMLRMTFFRRVVFFFDFFCLSKEEILEYIAFKRLIAFYWKSIPPENAFAFLVYLYIGNYLDPVHEISSAWFHSSGAWPTEPTTLMDPCVDGASPITAWNILPATPRQREWVTCLMWQM